MLNSVSRVDFRALMEVLDRYRPCLQYRSIKALYLSQYQHLEPRKTFLLQSNASDEIVHMFFDEIRRIGYRVPPDAGKGREFGALLSWNGNAGELSIVLLIRLQ